MPVPEIPSPDVNLRVFSVCSFLSPLTLHSVKILISICMFPDICYLEICQVNPSLPIYPALFFLNTLLYILNDFYFSTNFIFIFFIWLIHFVFALSETLFFPFPPKIHPPQKPFHPADTHIPDSCHPSNLTVVVLQAISGLLHLGEELPHWGSYHPAPPHYIFMF